MIRPLAALVLLATVCTGCSEAKPRAAGPSPTCTVAQTDADQVLAVTEPVLAWSRALGQKVEQVAVIVDGVVAELAAGQGRPRMITMLDDGTGATVWQRPVARLPLAGASFGARIDATTLPAEAGVLLSDLGGMTALSGDAGTVRWSLEGAGYQGHTDALVLVVDAGIAALDPTTGVESWRVPWGVQASSDDDVVVIAGEGRLAGVDGSTGAILWDTTTVPDARLLDADQVVVTLPALLDDDGNVEAVAHDRRTGKLLWRAPVTGPADIGGLGGDCVLLVRSTATAGSSSSSGEASLRVAQIRSTQGVVGTVDLGASSWARAVEVDGQPFISVGDVVYDPALRQVLNLPAGTRHSDLAGGFYNESVVDSSGPGTLKVSYTPSDGTHTVPVLSVPYRRGASFSGLPGPEGRALVVADDTVTVYRQAP